MTLRLAVLGGSAVSTVQFIDAIGQWPGGQERRPQDLTLVLHGRSDRLDTVAAACQQRAVARGVPVAVDTHRELAAALDGADVVLNQIRPGGLEARAWDESFPQQHGIPGEETMGPGGFASASRTAEALRPIWAQVAQHAPGALIINLTNPAGIIQHAARTEFSLPVVTACDSPLTLLDTVARHLSLPGDTVRGRYVGMNHAGWYVPAHPDELERISEIADRQDAALAALHEAMPIPYVRYYAYADRILAAQRGRPTRAEMLLDIQRRTLDTYMAGILPERWPRPAPWYALAVLPLIDGWLNGSPRLLIAGLPNAGRLPWLPPDAIVEGPVLARAPGTLEPQPVASLPDLPRGLLAEHAAYERLAVQAITGIVTTAAITRALLANPMVRSADQASALAGVIMRELGHGGG